MYPEYPGWESHHHQGRVTWERSPGGEQSMVSPSPAGTVDQELGGRDMMSRDVTRDSETVILASDWSIFFILASNWSTLLILSSYWSILLISASHWSILCSGEREELT